MLRETKDFDLLVKATEQVRDFSPLADLKVWYEGPGNFMLSDGDSVGIATFEYPGLYNIHWFFGVRGRAALNLATDMLRYIFDHKDVKGIRGWIRDDLKPSKWGARQVGMKSLGVFTDPKGTYELFYMTKEDFKDKVNG